MNRKARRSGAFSHPGNPQETMQQLVSLCRAQRFQEAMPLAREFTRKWPKHAVGWHALATCMQSTGKLDKAIDAYRKALAIEPENADGHNNLGLLLLEIGDSEEAVKSFRRAIRIRPGFGLAHYNLGLAFEAMDRWEDAAGCHGRAIEVNPGFAEAWNHLGNVWHRMGQVVDAERCYRKVLTMQPDYAEVYSNLGNVLSEQQRLVDAESCYRHAIELKPEFAQAYSNLGRLLRQAGRVVESEAVLRDALEMRSEDIGLRANLAATLIEIGNAEEAERLYRAIVEDQPDEAEAHDNLGNALADLGRIDEAAECYRRALALRPDFAQTRFHLSLVKRFGSEDSDRAEIEDALASESISDRDRVYLEYAAGKAWADVGNEQDRAFAHYARGAAIKRASLDYDIAQDEAMFEATERIFNSSLLSASSVSGCPSDKPVFIVGMPRSGSSLVEQILSNHPRVHGAGERADLSVLIEATGRRRGQAFPHWVPELGNRELTELGNSYTRTMVDPVPEADRVTDKMLSNFVYAGLIRLMLPNARVIHVRRNPLDTCLSCFTYLFAGRHAITYDLRELGRYYRAYDALMTHWRSVLPADFLLEIHYEDLVNDPENWVSRMLDHCGLEWEPACLDFHRSERAVRTASAQQVRQPIYRRSVGRWEQYRDHLGPLIEALGPLAPTDAEP